MSFGSTAGSGVAVGFTDTLQEMSAECQQSERWQSGRVSKRTIFGADLIDIVAIQILLFFFIVWGRWTAY